MIGFNMFKYMFFLCLNLIWASAVLASDDSFDNSSRSEPSARECLQKMVLDEPKNLAGLTDEQQYPEHLADLKLALKSSCIQNSNLFLLIDQQEVVMGRLEKKISELKIKLKKQKRFNSSKMSFLESSLDSYNTLQAQYVALQTQSNAKAAQDAATIDDLKKQIELLKGASKPE